MVPGGPAWPLTPVASPSCLPALLGCWSWHTVTIFSCPLLKLLPLCLPEPSGQRLRGLPRLHCQHYRERGFHHVV